MNNLNERQKKMIQSIEEKTGKKANAIITDIKKQTFIKHSEIIAYVKNKYSLTHGFANLLALISKQDTSEKSDDELANDLFVGKENLLIIYKEIVEYIADFEGSILIPKKGYISVRRNKQFAIIKPSTKTRLDLGLKFPKEIDPPIEKSGSFNKMVTHRIRIESTKDFDSSVKKYLKEAYEQA